MVVDWLQHVIERFSSSMPADFWLEHSFMVKGLIAVVLVSWICGSVGSLVVGNRMAFFSDALAHCAFAGVTLGMLVSLSSFQPGADAWIVPAFMVGFGVLVGLAIAFVREHSSLASDTIIGVFFAFAIGLGAMLLNVLRRSTYMDPERFLFGSLYAVTEGELLMLVSLAALLSLVLLRSYNAIVLGSFNPSLARSRGICVRLWNYVFIVLLALIVNLCIRAVGALLINALLVVPAATAANLGRGVRAMHWWATAVSLTCGILGFWMSFRVELPNGSSAPIPLVPSGTIVVLCVLAFIASLGVRMFRDRRISRAVTQTSNA